MLAVYVEQIHTHLLTRYSNRLQMDRYCPCKSPLHDLAGRDDSFHSKPIKLLIPVREYINDNVVTLLHLTCR